jgi:predicted RNA-binding Zn-ribbon protein involved in translation (DUF1610 family)
MFYEGYCDLYACAKAGPSARTARQYCQTGRLQRIKIAIKLFKLIFLSCVHCRYVYNVISSGAKIMPWNRTFRDYRCPECGCVEILFSSTNFVHVGVGGSAVGIATG